MKTAEEIWDKHFDEWVIAGQIKRNAIPAMIEYAEEVVKNNLAKSEEKAPEAKLRMPSKLVNR